MHKFSAIQKQPEGPKLEFKKHIQPKPNLCIGKKIVIQDESGEREFKSTFELILKLVNLKKSICIVY